MHAWGHVFESTGSDFVNSRARHLIGVRRHAQAMPEPLRSKMLFGDFKAGREDNAYQVIPSEWVRLAQEHWGTPYAIPCQPAAAR